MAEQKDSIEQFGADPAGVVRRWVTELEFAEKRDKEWIKTGKRVMDIYRGKARKRNSFNILYSNTETLAAAIYNAPPKPDVRRRFKDSDPVGKEVSKVLERALEFSIDNDQFSQALTEDVLDLLLPGRGVSRVRYVPSFVAGPDGQEDEDAPEKPDDEAMETEANEELAWQQALIDHVNWEDYRQGPGRTWKEVCWVAFRHRLGREELKEKFGEEIGSAIPLDNIDTDDAKNDQVRNAEVFKTAEIWEIWDKDERKVLFISQGYKAQPCLVLDDPLRLIGFFPCPRPIRAVADASSQEIIPLYEQYREQAAELDKISTRINKIIEALRVRGIYDSTMTDLSQLMRGEDNDLIAAENVSAWIDRGGIEKAIWMMPIEGPAKVLQVLYQQRDASKQVIYEITGISDVMRAVTDPNETLGAQRLKAQFGGQRINRLQAEVQRYARDLIRLMSEVIAEKFEPETLMKMTGTSYPTQQQVDMQMQQAQMQAQQAQMQWQQQAQMAQQQGQQPPPQPEVPPPPQPPVTIDQIMAILRDDVQRTYRIDVETDSMIAASQQENADEINQLAQGVIGLMGGLTQVVQSGAMPIESAKEIMLSITRRAKMGTAVEDAIDKLQMPKDPPDPNAGKAEAEQAKLQATMQIEQAKLQGAAQLKQMEVQLEDQKHQRELAAEEQRAQSQAQLDAQLQANEQRVQAEQNAHQNNLESQRAQQQAELDAQLESQKQDAIIAVEQLRLENARQIAEMEQAYKDAQDQRKDELERWKVEMEYRKAIEVAQISAATTLEAAQASAAMADSKGEPVKSEKAPDVHIHMPSGKRTIRKNPDGSYSASDE